MNRPHRVIITTKANLGEWIYVSGTHFLIGHALYIEMDNGSSVRALGYSAVSLDQKYKIMAWDDLLSVDTPTL